MHFREQLLELASAPTSLDNVTTTPLLPTIQRRDGQQTFNAKQHLDRGMSVFSEVDYVRSYNIMDTEYE